MKNSFRIFFTVLSLSFTAYSCSSIESDATKLAELACKKEQAPDMEQRNQLEQAYDQLKEKLKPKYKGKKPEEKQFEEIYYKKLEDCLGYKPNR